MIVLCVRWKRNLCIGFLVGFKLIQWKQWQTIFWGSKITADGDCSHEIKWHFLPGRKAITNLDSILKSRDITLPTNFCLVKALVFPLVMYGCESLIRKQAERQRIGVFELWCWRRFLRVPWTAKRSNQSILKEISPKYSLEGLMLKLKLQYFHHLRWRADSLEKTLMLGKMEGRRRRGRQMVGWHHWLNGHEFDETLGVGDGQGGLVCFSPWGCKDSDMTEWLNWTEYFLMEKKRKRNLFNQNINGICWKIFGSLC